MVLSSAAGSFLVVRLAGERRSRSGRLEAIVGWGLSMTAGALFAVFAWRARILAPDAAVVTAASLVSILAALFGATLAARRGSGRSLAVPLVFRPVREDALDEPGSFDLQDASDEPTILPPAH